MKKAFSLVELLVVIGIIAVLSGVFIASFAGGTEAARGAKCLSNLHNLAAAWGGGKPAGSQELISMKLKLGGSGVSNYTERKGWVSSMTDGLYPSESHQGFEPISLYEQDFKRAQYALTNGWMFAALGHDKSLFVCPSHVQQGGKRPNWSYLMNAYFGWDAAQGGHSYLNDSGILRKIDLTNADRLLIFSEVPFRKGGPGDWFPDGESGGVETDGILQYDGCNKARTAVGDNCYNGNETIGCNHKNGKNWFAHVAFADGHVEKLRVDGLSGENLKELTTWLCEGKAVGRNGSKYEELDKDEGQE